MLLRITIIQANTLAQELHEVKYHLIETILTNKNKLQNAMERSKFYKTPLILYFCYGKKKIITYLTTWDSARIIPVKILRDDDIVKKGSS